MRILVTGPTYQNQPQSVVRALIRQGHDVQLYSMADFYMGARYWQKKIYKLGYHDVKHSYEECIARELQEICRMFRPDFVLVLNGLMISAPSLRVLQEYDKALWMWDSFHRAPRLKEIFPCFRRVYTFEKQDADELKDRYDVEASWLPLGYDDTIFYPKEVMKNIDISFIGIPTPRRLRILDRIAEYAEQENRAMLIGGPWYSTEHFWKKHSFKRKHPALMRYVYNQIFSPEEAADIYRRSRICLNVIVEGHGAYNPRMLEIAATGSKQILIGADGESAGRVANLICVEEEQAIRVVSEILQSRERKATETKQVEKSATIYQQVKHILEEYEDGE